MIARGLVSLSPIRILPKNQVTGQFGGLMEVGDNGTLANFEGLNIIFGPADSQHFGIKAIKTGAMQGIALRTANDSGFASAVVKSMIMADSSATLSADFAGLQLQKNFALSWTGSTFFGAADTDLTRDAPGSIRLGFGGPLDSGSGNGQFLRINSREELTTISTAATTATVINFPANSLQFGVSVRVITAIPTAATFSVGTTENATRYGTGILTSSDVTSQSAGTTSPIILTSTASVVITPNAAPNAATGQVRVTLYYLDLTPPTN